MAEGAVALQSFAAHVREFRARLFSVAVVVAIGTGFGLWQGAFLRDVLVKPIGQTLYYTSPAGGFNLTIELALFFGAILAVPVATYQFLKFVEPAFPGAIGRRTFSYAGVACVLLCLGVAFAYFVALPGALYFLTDFSNNQIRSLVTVDEYVSFVGNYVLAFAIFFQLPLISLLVYRVSHFPVKALERIRSHVFVAAFIVAAVITPTGDPLNMTIMALPIVVLYEISIMLVKVASRRSGAVEELVPAYAEAVVEERALPAAPRPPLPKRNIDGLGRR